MKSRYQSAGAQALEIEFDLAVKIVQIAIIEQLGADTIPLRTLNEDVRKKGLEGRDVLSEAVLRLLAAGTVSLSADQTLSLSGQAAQ